MPVAYAVLVALALGSLLIPAGRVVPLLIAAPLVLAVARRREGDQSFLWWAAYALGYVVFVYLRNYAHEWTPVEVQSAYVVGVDRWIGLGVLPTHLLQRLYRPGEITALTTLSIITHASFFFLQTTLAAALWFWKAPHWSRYMRASVITWAASIVMILLLPTAPPWMVASDGDIARVHRVLYNVLTQTAPSTYNYGVAIAGVNPVAAMPSLHFAGALLVSYGLWHWHWTARLPAVLYSLAMAFSLVYLGEHWVADLIPAAIIVALAWRIAR
jgi:hypothetical protein